MVVEVTSVLTCLYVKLIYSFLQMYGSKTVCLYVSGSSFCRIKPHCEVSNALKKWHIAYHGTSVGALRRTLDHSQLLPGRNMTFHTPLRSEEVLQK